MSENVSDGNAIENELKLRELEIMLNCRKNLRPPKIHQDYLIDGDHGARGHSMKEKRKSIIKIH